MRFFDGKMDEYAAYDRPLNKYDIAAIYGVPPHLIGLPWRRFWRIRAWLIRARARWWRLTHRAPR